MPGYRREGGFVLEASWLGLFPCPVLSLSGLLISSLCHHHVSSYARILAFLGDNLFGALVTMGLDWIG
jgi:hypothetical protein